MYNDFYLDYYQLFYYNKLEKCYVYEYLLYQKTVTVKFEDGTYVEFELNKDLEDSNDTIIIINSNEKKFKKIMYKTIFYHERK